MRAFMIVSDAAAAHADGTFSMLRGGINQINASRSQSIPFHGSIVVRVNGEISERGRKHTFSLACIDADGARAGGGLDGHFQFPPNGNICNIVVNMNTVLPKAGRYEFVLNINGEQRDAWPIDVRETAPAAPQSGQSETR